MPITANVLERVLYISNGPAAGTAFTIEVDGAQYLVTAAHLLATPGRQVIQVWHGSAWAPLSVDVLAPVAGPHDVAVMRLSHELTPTLPLEPNSDGMVLGQDAFFLGYPLRDEIPLRLSSRQPLPLVKKGVVSAFHRVPSTTYLAILLDGFNVQGFSGGPIVFRPQASTSFRVAGVISGFRAREDPVFDGPHETELRIRSNTGIVVGWDIACAVQAIRGARS